MACLLVALAFDAHDPVRLASFWGGVLGWEICEDPERGDGQAHGDRVLLADPDGHEFCLLTAR